jgi:hypothetical protein
MEIQSYPNANAQRARFRLTLEDMNFDDRNAIAVQTD